MTALVLAVSLLLAGPAVLAVARGTGSVDTALLHLVLALVASTVAGHVLRILVRGYQAQAAEAEVAEAGEGEPLHGRRRTDF
ncbi:hypothetical protein [Kineococcus sp. SYSU DK003]|uniref:hypothetical protein n=1 Tax=Kineococcus sp. SYSU DK003 TaxID=3383124 RepID=UPI003D7D0F1F